ncbi:glutaminase A [Lactobacillus sp. PSON]|uniref:glutaminase A n=1 Tax=Lactobacillus sp. PSON TaxID=3455454 RepID=UPI004042C057
MDLSQLITKNLPVYNKGKVASYIPMLAQVDPKQLGVTLFNLKSNQVNSAGDYDVRFAIESISKVITLLWAIKKLGMTEVFKHVSSRQTGFAFNSILNMEIENTNVPLNPFVNAGAILTTSLIAKDTAFDDILNFAQKICNDSQIYLDEEIFNSEKSTGDLDRSLAYYMKSKNMIKNDITLSLDIYFKQCSMMVTTKSLANLGALLANDGIAPWNNHRLISSNAATCVKSLMMTTGLYNQSGICSRLIGVPTKSGVGGGLVCASPEKYGIGIFSPALNKDGNSIAGLALLKDIAKELKINIFR